MSPPFVGQMVHFHQSIRSEPMAAIVTSVISEVCVNLTVFNTGGSIWHGGSNSIYFADGNAINAEGPYCCSICSPPAHTPPARPPYPSTPPPTSEQPVSGTPPAEPAVPPTPQA